MKWVYQLYPTGAEGRYRERCDLGKAALCFCAFSM
uniref:Uncharacterized protein n=1 Tax=Anguilla anguilla TaxID=7936 RepID=A0A0E9XHM5_ANGAN